MVNKGTKPGVSTGPPRELNVWKFVESRASELEGLHAIVAQCSGNSFRSRRNKRRRTTGHDDRIAKREPRKKRKVGEGNAGESELVSRDKKKVSRRVRRTIELKKNPPHGFSTSGDGTKRMRTHVWHAKRFTMKKLWGFYIPVGLHGRGRGSRAILKKLKHGALLHDASYYVAIQLEGSEDKLMSILNSVLVPSPSACSEETRYDILAGCIFGTAMLHHAGKTCSSPIAPVAYMWRPPQGISIDTLDLISDVSDGEHEVCDGTIVRRLLVWVHAAAFQEAYESFSSACGRQIENIPSAHCVSREGQLARLELVGSKVFELLQKTLLPARCKCVSHEHQDPVESDKTLLLQNGLWDSSTSAVSVVVKDPRVLTKNRNFIVPEEKPLGLLSTSECQVKEQSSLSPEHEAGCMLQCSDLWDASTGVCPPLEERILCMEKHHQRKEFVCLSHKTSGLQSSIPGKCSRVCPVLLLKHETNGNSVARCSIILPLSWVKAFWMTFVLNGAHAIGLRERHWVACELGLPYFPLDYPDCKAYSDFMAMEAVEINQKAMLRPPSKRPLEVPVPPPWNCLNLTLAKRLSATGNSLSQPAQLGAHNNKNDVGSGEPQIQPSVFEGIIARTTAVLSDHLNSINERHLCLSPRNPDQENFLYKFMRDKDFLKHDNVVADVKRVNTLCYVRVFLHAYRKGVFEQGALVCAPLLADIMMWKDVSESDDQNLQIPQASLWSYFTQLPSGRWEVQLPEDQSLHRWPIGFVTTGFVRGSKKATAGALCEASLLYMLREEQWKAMPEEHSNQEIYVLVRNMRSTAYRLALATIVLEKQEKDVEFI